MSFWFIILIYFHFPISITIINNSNLSLLFQYLILFNNGCIVLYPVLYIIYIYYIHLYIFYKHSCYINIFFFSDKFEPWKYIDWLWCEIIKESCELLLRSNLSLEIWENVSIIFERISRHSVLESKHRMHLVPMEQHHLVRRSPHWDTATVLVRNSAAIDMFPGNRRQRAQSSRSHTKKYAGNRVHLHER